MNVRWLIASLVVGLLLAACGRGTPPPPEPSTAIPSPATTPTPEPAPATNTPVTVGPALADLEPGWTKVEPGGDTRCALDTPYAFWVRPGTVNKLLVFFQGGGGCWSAETCAPGSSFYDYAVSSDDNPDGQPGILDNSPNNPFRDYHAVYIPSCTGDVHWGDNVQIYAAADGNDLTIYHRGFANARAALAWAYDNLLAPESVFVTGCSAGSVGSIAHSPYIIEQYPEARVTQLGDSLAFVFHRPVDLETNYQAHQNFPEWIPGLAAIAPGELIMSDYYAAVANHYPDYTFAQFNSAADSVQDRYYQAIGGLPGDFPGALADSLNAIHTQAGNFRSFTAEGTLHCITPRPQFYTLETEGVSFLAWIEALAASEAVDNVKCPACDG